VELRKSVIHIAIDHFFAPNDARVNFHNRNGIDYLNDASVHSADMVFADMYQAYSMEGFQSTDRFLEQCWKLLTADGWLVINFHELPDFGDPYLDRMCDLFPEVLCCGTSSGNYVVMCGKQKLSQSLPEFKHGLDELERRFDVCLERSFARIFKISTPGAERARANRRVLRRST
jgi:spermidine synthase